MRRPSRKKVMLFNTFIIASVGIGIIALFRACNSDVSPELANILLKTKEGKYLYTDQANALVEVNIKNKEVPPAFGSLEVFKDGGAYYVNPAHIEALVDVLSGNVDLHPYNEASSDGYIASGEEERFSMDHIYRSTQNVGMQIIENSVHISNGKGKTMLIQWQFDPNDEEVKALKNCEVRGFWIETKPAPGETVYSTKDFLVISLDELAKFFGKEISYDSDKRLCVVKG